MKDKELVTSIVSTLGNLGSRIRVQKTSYTELDKLLNNKEQLLAHTPAIQPVSNKDLNRIASGFGHRIDPIYKTVKMHAGLDFAAPQGTPIYATADGTVKVSGNTGNGYGNHVVITHGYGYETLYGHMVRVKSRPGQAIKRGEVIGWVGSTGKSTGHIAITKYINTTRNRSCLLLLQRPYTGSIRSFAETGSVFESKFRLKGKSGRKLTDSPFATHHFGFTFPHIGTAIAPLFTSSLSLI
ncbi:MAG: M23 family metallopeptidase [Bacteroidota bacterium]